MEIFLNDVFYVASLSQFIISLTLQSAYILNGAKWVGHPPGKIFMIIFMTSLLLCMYLIAEPGSIPFLQFNSNSDNSNSNSIPNPVQNP